MDIAADVLIVVVYVSAVAYLLVRTQRERDDWW